MIVRRIPGDLRRRIRWDLDLSKLGFVMTPRDLFATCYKMKTIADKGWTEVIIDDNCGFDRFYLIALILERTLKSSYTEKLTGLETAYCIFKYKLCKLVLHYNIYMGITIFPATLKDATQFEKECVIEIGTLLNQQSVKC